MTDIVAGDAPAEIDDTTTAAGWLTQRRLDAVAWIGERGYPTRRDEAWRYAPLKQLGELSFGPPVDLVWEMPDDFDQHLPIVMGPRIVIVNGRVDRDRSDIGERDGLTMSSLADVLGAATDDEVDPVLREHVDPSGGIADAHMALNIAYGLDGAVIRVAPGVALDHPINIVDVELPDETNQGSCSGVVIELGDGASATVVETRFGYGTEFGGSNIRTTVSLGDDASLDHVIIQDVAVDQLHLGRVTVSQAGRSTYRSRSFNLGGRFGRLDWKVSLDGEQASTDLAGLFFGRGEQTLDQQIQVDHRAPNCTSRQAFRGVLDDRSTGVFSGGIAVSPGADGTDATQSNDNLVLSDRAEVNTQPRLEILADGVACAHGATVGELDPTALYYMQTRGIDATAARQLLIEAFADQAIDEVELPELRDWLTARIGHTHE